MSNKDLRGNVIEDVPQSSRIDLTGLNTVDLRIYKTQNRFLDKYQKAGTIKSAAGGNHTGPMTRVDQILERKGKRGQG